MNNGSSDYLGSVNVGDLVTTNPVITSVNSVPQILIGTRHGYIKTFSLGALQSIPPSLIKIDSSSSNFLSIERIICNGNYYSYIDHYFGPPPQIATSANYLFADNSGASYGLDGIPLDFALTVDKSGNNAAIILLSNNTINIVTGGKISKKFNINSIDSIKSFALADLKQDGGNYIIFADGNDIDAVNLQGAEADNFPFVDPEGVGFSGTPLTADFAGDNKSEVIAATKDGRIYAIDGGTGKIVNSFPISSGSGFTCTPVLFDYQSRLSLAMLNIQGNFSAWQIGANEGKVFWAEENGNSQNTSYIPAASNQNIDNAFFPAARSYNYPNPVYGGVTNIHYYVAEDSKIDIKIFDLAGDFVAELKDNAQGGSEKETQWNVSNIQSGVYFASIKATGTSGKTDTNVIKIAVIK